MLLRPGVRTHFSNQLIFLWSINASNRNRKHKLSWSKIVIGMGKARSTQGLLDILIKVVGYFYYDFFF